MNTSSIQTTIQETPKVRVSAAYRESSGLYQQGLWYWEVWCFSDDPRLKSFQSPSTAYSREGAQRIHDGIVRAVTRKLL